MPATLEIHAPSRLHFGMFSFGRPGVRQFGGIGAMIDAPGLRLRITGSQEFVAQGPLAGRVRKTVESWYRQQRRTPLPRCHVEVLAAPPEHVGLGTGTQLALSVVRGVSEFESGRTPTLAELVAWSGRGVRSSVGSYGFMHGGLIAESGKAAGERLAPLEARIPLPDDWRFVVVYPHDQRGLSGDAELLAFRTLPPVPGELAQQLRKEAIEQIIPGAYAGDFECFSRGVYRFGHTAGLCFAPQQAGAFASAEVEGLVQTIRAWGIEGVGQSSWGPAVFAILETPDDADDFARRVANHVGPSHTVIVARLSERGATVVRHE